MHSNPFLNLDYEPALENLGDGYYDRVAAAEFPRHILRFRNDQILPLLGLSPATVRDDHFIEAFGKFQGICPFLALRYHGYQFGEYNPHLGDGRGFLYGQIRGRDGQLYDFSHSCCRFRKRIGRVYSIISQKLSPTPAAKIGI